MHTMWKGSISFGLVNIPIKLFAATEDKDIKLRSLHKECRAPIQYEKSAQTAIRKSRPTTSSKATNMLKANTSSYQTMS